jgi:hypothetical protein
MWLGVVCWLAMSLCRCGKQEDVDELHLDQEQEYTMGSASRSALWCLYMGLASLCSQYYTQSLGNLGID